MSRPFGIYAFSKACISQKYHIKIAFDKNMFDKKNPLGQELLFFRNNIKKIKLELYASQISNKKYWKRQCKSIATLIFSCNYLLVGIHLR